MEGGIGDEKISAECRINLFWISSGTLAVGASSPLDVRLLQEISKLLAFELAGFNAQMPGQSAIRSEYSTRRGGHYDQVANRIKSVEPLPAGIRRNLEKRNVLHSEAEKIGNVDQEIFFVG